MISETPQLRTFDVWGAPYDGAATLGWPGSRYAPEAIRRAMRWMLQRREEDQIYCLDCSRLHPFPEHMIVDHGDARTVAHDLDRTLEAATEAVAASARRAAVPVLLGGDDSLLYAAVRGVAETTSGTVAIIHFDAHLDMLDENLQQGRYSHSSGMRRSLELPNVDPARCVQVGSRHFNFPTSLAARERVGLANIPATAVHRDGVETVVDQVLDRVEGAQRVVLAFDIDTIDPAHAPGAGAHEPGGLTSRQAIDAVQSLAAHCHAMALTEVNPLTDSHDRTVNLAAYLTVHFAVHGAGEAHRSP